jgi:hypothetical protein
MMRSSHNGIYDHQIKQPAGRLMRTPLEPDIGMSDEQGADLRTEITPYEIMRSQLVGNFLALCVTFVLITVHGRSTDAAPRADGSLMKNTMEQRYSPDDPTAVRNRRTDAAARIMARHGEMNNPLALSQADNDNRVYQSGAGSAASSREETFRKGRVMGH